MDDGSDSSLWRRLTKAFHGKPLDAVEQAINDAGEEGELDTEERSMLLSVLRLDELQVQDIMTTRTDIVCAPEESDLTALAELIVSSGHSRIPVYSGNRDNITGIIHAKDMLERLLHGSAGETPASLSMRPPYFVPETKHVLELLQEFRSKKVHLAVILDEYGGTAGIVTIEDVLEQIVGDIEDEHDTPKEQEISPQPDGSFIVAGRAWLEDLAEATGLALESEEVDTIGGYLTHIAGRVPKAGECFLLNGTEVTVLRSNPRQIHTVRIPAQATAPSEPENRQP